MEKLRCVVLDDEPIGREIIENFVNQTPFLECSGSFGDPVEAMVFLKDHPTDVLLSDIQMPGINGLDLVRTLQHPPVIIFITAHRDFALDGFETGAMDYLVKPVRFSRFLKAVTKAKDLIDLKRRSAGDLASDRIFIKTEGKLTKLMLNQILYVEAQGDYLKMVTDSETFTTLSTLKSMEELLKLPQFFRVQRSFIISLEDVHSVTGNMAEMKDGKHIAIANNKKEELYQLLGIK